MTGLFLTLVSGLATAVLAALASGYTAYAFIEWFHLYSRDGGNVYLVCLVGFLGGLLGLVTGVVTARYVPPATAAGFFKATGISFAVMLAVIGSGVLATWLVADIPPTTDGHLLKLAVEFRLPAGETETPPAEDKDSYVLLCSTPAGSHTVRKKERGFLKLREARQVNGRWIIPGTVFIFTTRGQRSVVLKLGDRTEGFLVPMTRRPGHRYDEWSEWLPRGREEAPWPETEVSYRFRVEPMLPGPPSQPEDVAAKAFAALAPDAPLEQWLSFLGEGIPAEREEQILRVAAARHAELARDIRSTDDRTAQLAMGALPRLKAIGPDVVAAMGEVEQGIEADIARLNAMRPEDAGYVELGARVRDRFNRWHRAWWTVHHVVRVDARAPLERLLGLARQHAENGFLQEVILNGEAHLSGISE